MEQDYSQITFIILASTFFMLLMAGFIILLVFIHRNRQLKNRQKVAELKATHEQILLTSRLEMQEETLHLVGQELHDNIGQILSLVKLNLTHNLEDEANQAKPLLSQAIKEVRALSKRLNLSWAEEISLQAFIHQELDKIENTGLIKTVREVAEESPALLTNRKVVLFRIIQEVLNNVLKHAQADKITFKLATQGDQLMIEISDNGVGFDIAEKSTGSGLYNLHSRAMAIGGDFQIQSLSGLGTNVKIKLPLL